MTKPDDDLKAASFDRDKTSNDEINAHIAAMAEDGYELVSFDDDRHANMLRFSFRKRPL